MGYSGELTKVMNFVQITLASYTACYWTQMSMVCLQHQSNATCSRQQV